MEKSKKGDQGRWSVGQDLNPRQPEYEAGFVLIGLFNILTHPHFSFQELLKEGMSIEFTVTPPCSLIPMMCF